MASIMIVFTILSMMGVWGVKYYTLTRKKVSWQAMMKQRELQQKHFWRILSIILAIICIAIYIGLRWGNAAYNIGKHSLFTASPSEYRSANISIFLTLDLCSLLGVLLPILVIFDWKHKYLLRPVALLGLLGGCATVFFTTPDLYGDKWDLQTFFIGSRKIGVSGSDEPLMFLMHYWMIMMALIILVNDRKITWKTYLSTVACILVYAGYITLISQLLNIQTHVTATVVGDFELLDPSYYALSGPLPAHPSYKIFCEIYGVTNWKWAAVDTWITFGVIVTLFVAIKNIAYFNLVRTNLIQDYDAKFPFMDFVVNSCKKMKSLR